ncbi:hypothetical protein [Streptomyces sp. NPDC006668]|uniref:hypothetical protein n=1 Tax=Streptomyces sp. NPDC006668 TaxID=3156903 RepID=UPI003407AA30
MLLTGREQEGLAELRKAISLVGRYETASVISSVVAPLQDFLTYPLLLPPPAATAVAAAVAECQQYLPDAADS